MNTRSTFRFLRIALGLVLLSSLVLGEVTPASAALRCYVKANATGTNNGTTWANAYKSLQSALGTSPCTEVWVAKGTYKPTTNIDRTKSFVLKNGVAIYGGFAGNETLLSQRQPVSNQTILSGNIGNTAVATDNSYHVVVGSNTDSTARLDGFTITGGNANSDAPLYYGGGGMRLSTSSPTLANLFFSGNSAKYGGGMYNIASSSPNLMNVTFGNNSAIEWGGGMLNNSSSPSLTKVTFSGNSAGYGGGMQNLGGSNPSLTNVTFSTNAATYSGGGMYNEYSSPTLTNVTFIGNLAGFSGGGAYNYKSSLSLRNVTFSGNSASEFVGGGMYNEQSSPSLLNVTFSGNSAPGAGGMYNLTSTATIKNSILYGDIGGEIVDTGSSTIIVTYSIIQGGLIGEGNLDADPLLKTLANNGGFTKTMALTPGSPAIDKGTNTGCPAKDQRGAVRPQGLRCDMGAYELRQGQLTLYSTGSQDGVIQESGENTGVGGAVDATGLTFAMGDDAADRQGRSILSFNTAALPDNATIASVTLKIKKAGLVGTDPFSTHGNLLVDVRKGAFNNNAALEVTDFQAPAGKNAAMTITNVPPIPVNGWYSKAMAAANFIYINKVGLTQFRLRFALDDNEDMSADYLKFYSGNYATVADRPILIIKYYAP